MGKQEAVAGGPMIIESNGKRWTVGGGKPPRVERLKDE